MNSLIVLSVLLAVQVFAAPSGNELDLRFHQIHTGANSPLPRGTWDFAPSNQASSFLAFGGVVDNLVTHTDTFFNDLWEFTSLGHDSGRWREINPSNNAKPSKRAFHGFDTVEDFGGKKYACLFGGANTFQPFVVAADEFWCFDIQENVWINLSALPGPSARSGPLVTARGSELWVVGGVVPDPATFFLTLNDTWKFDFNCMKWTQLLPKNTYPPRHIGMGGFIKDAQNFDRILMYGGETIAPFFDFGIANDTWEYSVNENNWFQVDTSDPTPRRNYGTICISKNGKSATTFGGDQPGPNGHNPISSIWDYDVIKADWKERKTMKSTMPPPTKRVACERIGDQMFIAGGYDVQYFPNGTISSQTFLNTVYSIGL